MSYKSRRFSLDSSVSLEGVGLLGCRRGSRITKRSRGSQSLDDTQLEIQDLSHSLAGSISFRDQIIAEENLDRPDGRISRSSFLKHNKTFHKLFQDIPEGENLTHTFTCALQKEVLYHGKLFVSENYVCFYSSVLLKDTKVVIPVSSVREVKKQKTALSMLSIHTADGEKHSFVSLRNRELCYSLLHSVCLQVQQGESANSSAHEDEDMLSSYSSMDDSVDHSRHNSIGLDNGFPHLSDEGPQRSSYTPEASVADEEDTGVPRTWSITEWVAPLLFLREISNLGALFYIYVILLVLLLLASGYIGLRIIALEEQLNSLGALTELTFHQTEYQET
ncbi:GRAM domain-containing protein 2B-like isoform X2 [Myripristis murdjan]|uniref:GRAM domain-containing protein 2B-like isoform X2 n=1 Tax=Myripristis murdjan TaxID=586833 RepID=UPI001175CD21|nr:GRAM domain-containing protein 2B-like isoform X2 [Myripristis murdjan]